jgi:hypothetical protein
MSRLSGFRRILLLRVLPVFVLLIIGAVVAAGFWPYTHPSFTRYALNELNRTGADSISISRVVIVPWRGFSADSLYLRMPLPHGRCLEFFARRLQIAYHPVTVVTQEKKLRGMLNGPRRRCVYRWMPRERPALRF